MNKQNLNTVLKLNTLLLFMVQKQLNKTKTKLNIQAAEYKRNKKNKIFFE
ncbi:hypothetical protein DB41_CW00060 [Neochlamydia sp. TUME1]|nr:hypothetical protein DB41_CW00060 [Neochlamydia sp. TUME1]